uniref:Glycosyl transferase family 1 domain-containing protein n=1 Tax=viral metagenome TaxID=1070528 RepID=A0A6C0K6K4_9ZZZZ
MELPSYLRSIDQTLAPMATPVATPMVTTTQTPTVTPTTSADKPSFTFQTAPQMSFTNSVEKTETGKNKKLKFMLVSTHIQQFTGYAKVSHGILEQLAKKSWLSLTHYGFQKHPQTSPDFRKYPSGVDVIDAATLEMPLQQGFGYSAFMDTIRKKTPDVVMIYNDMAVVTRFLEEIRKSGIQRTFKLWIYCDQVYDCQLQGMIDMLNRDADRVFAFTTYWKKQLKEQGITRPISVLGHGFDQKVFYTVPRELARKSLKLPDDAFVIMSLNRNQPRKRQDIMIMAFVELVVKYPTRPIILLCICDKGEKGGWWLFELFVRELKKRNVPIEQFGNRLMISSQDMVFKDEDINVLYNIADVGISTAEGEGWGLCTFEQMGVGVPQVVPDVGGYKEYCSSENSVIVKPAHRYYLPGVYSPVGGEAQVCNPHDVCLALEEYLNDSSKKLKHGAKAKETVLGYTWEKVVGELVKCLETERDDE